MTLTLTFKGTGRAAVEAVAVRYVSMLMRSHGGENALVSVAVRFGFAD